MNDLNHFSNYFPNSYQCGNPVLRVVLWGAVNLVAVVGEISFLFLSIAFKVQDCACHAPVPNIGATKQLW